MDYKFMYVLDYNNNKAYKIELNKMDKMIENTEIILKGRGLNLDECAYMYSDDELEFESIDLI